MPLDVKEHIVYELEWAADQMRSGLAANERGEDEVALDCFAPVFGPVFSALRRDDLSIHG